jgi:large subunit ribosomal protein L25
MQVSIECQKRVEGSKPRALRREGRIPATLYGHQGAESIALTVDAKEAVTLLKKASINNTLVDVNIPEMPWNGKALIREVQAHPWKRNLYHVSFFSIANQKTIEVVVPVKLVGESPGIKRGGILEQRVSELTVRCSPTNIPETIDIDLTPLKLGAMFHVKDIVFPENVIALDDPDKVIISIAVPAKIALTGNTEEEA